MIIPLVVANEKGEAQAESVQAFCLAPRCGEDGARDEHSLQRFNTPGRADQRG